MTRCRLNPQPLQAGERVNDACCLTGSPIRVPFTDVAVIDPAEEINELSGTLQGIQDVLDLDALRKQIAELEDQAAAPDLWNDTEQAQRVTSRLSHLQAEVNRVDGLGRRLEDLPILFELAAEEGDEDALAEAERSSPRSDPRSARSRSARCCRASTTPARHW
ncbi:hypothetical protein GCM10027612_25640 [Microbispora bryophytorum subsp. camponoti]